MLEERFTGSLFPNFSCDGRVWWHGNANHTQNSVSVPGQAPQPARTMVWLKGQYSSGYEQMNMNQWEKIKLMAGFKILWPLNAGVV